MHIEAENNELILKANDGSLAIIPARDRGMVQTWLKRGHMEAVDTYVSGLKDASSYAEDGTYIPHIKLQEELDALNTVRGAGSRAHNVATGPNVSYEEAVELFPTLGRVNEEDIVMKYDPMFNDSYGDIEHFDNRNKGNEYAYNTYKREDDSEYKYPNPVWGLEGDKRAVVYNSRVNSGDVYLDMFSHDPNLKNTNQYSKLRDYYNDNEDVKYFFDKDVESGRIEEDNFDRFRDNWIDGKLRAYAVKSMGDKLDLSPEVREDYGKEYFSTEEEKVFKTIFRDINRIK